MEEHHTLVGSNTITLNNNFTKSTNQQPDSHRQEQMQSKMTKHYSEPKFHSYKQEILKIPKVKQILNKDKFVYSSDIEKRLELIGTVKNDNYVDEEMLDLQNLRKPHDKKKNKRHKTNFKIPLTRENVSSLNNLIVKHISHNQKFKNEQVVFLKQYTQDAPFDLEKLKFLDKIDKVKVKFGQKYPDYNPRVLSRNKLGLENVILNRNIKRQMKLDQKKLEKQHAKNVMKHLDAKIPPNLLEAKPKKMSNKLVVS